MLIFLKLKTKCLFWIKNLKILNFLHSISTVFSLRWWTKLKWESQNVPPNCSNFHTSNNCCLPFSHFRWWRTGKMKLDKQKMKTNSSRYRTGFLMMIYYWRKGNYQKRWVVMVLCFSSLKGFEPLPSMSFLNVYGISLQYKLNLFFSSLMFLLTSNEYLSSEILGWIVLGYNHNSQIKYLSYNFILTNSIQFTPGP